MCRVHPSVLLVLPCGCFLDVSGLEFVHCLSCLRYLYTAAPLLTFTTCPCRSGCRRCCCRDCANLQQLHLMLSLRTCSCLQTSWCLWMTGSPTWMLQHRQAWQRSSSLMLWHWSSSCGSWAWSSSMPRLDMCPSLGLLLLLPSTLAAAASCRACWCCGQLRLCAWRLGMHALALHVVLSERRNAKA